MRKNDIIPTLGEKVLHKLGLIKRIFTIEQKTKSESVECKEKTTKDIVDRYANVFHGLESLEGEYSIQVSKTCGNTLQKDSIQAT